MTPFTNEQVAVILLLVAVAAGAGIFGGWHLRKPAPPPPSPPPQPEVKKPQRVPGVEVSPNLTTGKVVAVFRVTDEDGLASPNAFALTGVWPAVSARNIARLFLQAADVVDPPAKEE